MSAASLASIPMPTASVKEIDLTGPAGTVYWRVTGPEMVGRG